MDTSISWVKSLQEADLDWGINCFFSEYYTPLFTGNSVSIFTFVLFTQFHFFPYYFLKFT